MYHGKGLLKKGKYWYKGDFVNNKACGEGISLSMSLNSKLICYYEGEFENDEKESFGKEICAPRFEYEDVKHMQDALK